MTILCLPRPRDWRSRFLKTCAAERPSFNAVSAVTGSTFAVPRTPSVPKIFLGMLISIDWILGLLWRWNHQDNCWLNLHQGDIGRRYDIDRPAGGRATGQVAGEIHHGANLAFLQ